MRTIANNGHTITVFGEAEERTVEQLSNCLAVEEGSRGVLCADNHVGYSQPIGGAVAYREHISPSGVGYDIGCGNKAVRTHLKAEDIQADLPRIMDEIVSQISFGVGRKNDEPIDHPVLTMIRHANFTPQQQLAQLAEQQLGTVGAGNHYVDLFEGDDGYVWVGCHFGSRGFGHKTASGFLAIAAGKEFHEHAPEGEMFSPPIVFPTYSDVGQAYIEAMTVAGAYAYAGRDVVCAKVMGILGTTEEFSVHNHHNFAWFEEHDGEHWWVVRKGCTPSFDGQMGFVGSSMGEDSVILEGTAESESALSSTVHGAGRVMSRTAARGKFRRRKVYACMDRDCDRVFQLDGISAHRGPPREGVCPDHPKARVKKRTIMERKSEGKIDFVAALEDLAEKGIVLRGGDADEAPGAYKRLSRVLEAHGDTIQIKHRLRPMGVAMAGPDIYDPFKD
jgi:tRNA-splicing ligase RtcB